MLYCIKGSPIALQRPRFNSVRRIVYDNQKNERIILGVDLARQHNNRPLLEGPLKLYARFYMEMPIRMGRSQENTFMYVRPDLDNLVKFLLDISKDIILQDDKSVCSIDACKIYSKNPRTEFFFKQLDKDDTHKEKESFNEENK